MKLRRLAFLVCAAVALLRFAGGQRAGAPVAPGDSLHAIKHVVVIYQENESFDHYFGTYPRAVNLPGEPAFHALPNTPAVDGLTDDLLQRNPNLARENGADAGNPFRLTRDQAFTADKSHAYTAEQSAFDNDAMDLFPAKTGKAGGVPTNSPAPTGTTGLVMGYFDGNTVTAIWNLAQHYALNDNNFNTTFGPSSPGAINLISGQTNGVTITNGPSSNAISDGAGGFTLIGDQDPTGDVCSSNTNAAMSGRNIGDLLNAANVSWGWFEGGFDLALVNTNPVTGATTTGCLRASTGRAGQTANDYVPHHQPFQYYASTANPTHVRPTSVAAIGKQGDAANHQYDIDDFYAAVEAGNFPAVSFLKAPAFEDAHPGNSDPLDEQSFVVNVLNFLQQQAAWQNTAVIVDYDDSDGWYDHVASPFNNPSATASDTLNGANKCGTGTPAAGVASASVQGRCGFGPRTPLMVISPWAKPNYVDHTLTDQTSILRFIEDTFAGGARVGGGSFDATSGSLLNMFDFSKGVPQNTAVLALDPASGEIVP